MTGKAMGRGGWIAVVVVVLLIIAAPVVLADLTERFGEGVGVVIERWTDGR